MKRTIILLAREFPPALMNRLGSLGELCVFSGDLPEKDRADAKVFVATAMDPVSKETIESLPAGLRLIANFGVGTDNVDLEAARARGVAVSNTPVVTEDTADLTMALLLSACRRLSVNERMLREGHWGKETGSARMGQRVHGKTLGIVGFGAIGQAVAQRARGFGMEIRYHGPRRKAEAEARFAARYHPRLEDLLGASDVVALHCPLTPATRHLIDEERLGQMKPGAVLINTGRGPLIDERALVRALERDQLGAAGLDVFEFEPAMTPALLGFENVTLLPHIGSATTECRLDMALRIAENIRAALADEKIPDRVV